MTYYHGTPTDIDGELSMQFSQAGDCYHGQVRALGPGLYLTDNKKTVAFYVRSGGYTHTVEVFGQPELTIDLRRPFHELVRSPGLDKVFVSSQFFDFRYLADPDQPFWDFLLLIIQKHRDISLKMLYQELARNGVWMVYGELSPYARSGAMDAGVQYVVIQDGYHKTVDREKYTLPWETARGR